MGVAARTSSRTVKFGFAAVLAAALLYGAVVVFGIGPAFTASQPGHADDTQTVVRIAPPLQAAPGPVQKRPQASPGPARGHAKVSRAQARDAEARPTAGLHATAPRTTAKTPPPRREVTAEKQTSSGTAPPQAPSQTLPLPQLPPLPQVPPVEVPPLPVPLPPINPPKLPAPPQLPPLPLP